MRCRDGHLDRHRAADVVALNEVHAELAQQILGLLVLDELGDGSASTQQTSASAQELAATAEKLDSAVSRFKLTV